MRAPSHLDDPPRTAAGPRSRSDGVQTVKLRNRCVDFIFFRSLIFVILGFGLGPKSMAITSIHPHYELSGSRNHR